MVAYADAFKALNQALDAANARMVATTGAESQKWQRVGALILAEMSAITLAHLSASNAAYVALTVAAQQAEQQLKDAARRLGEAAAILRLIERLFGLLG